MATITSFTAVPFDTIPLAHQELSKWQADRERWEFTLPIMSWLSKFLELTPVLTEHADFASTDGCNLFFCPAYSSELSDRARCFLQAHLIWHCVAGHLTSPLIDHPHRWHLACDHEVNSVLLQLGLELPKEAVLFPVCFGRSALEVYDWLKGHPDPGLEVTPDIHPATPIAALMKSSDQDRSVLLQCWRQRAHLIAHFEPKVPPLIAAFCDSR